MNTDLTDRLIGLINTGTGTGTGTEMDKVLLRDLKIYKLFGVVPIIRHQRFERYGRGSRIDTVYLHFGVRCPNDNRITSDMYTDDLYHIHGQILPLDPQSGDLVESIYRGERGDGDQRIYVVTYPDDPPEGDIIPATQHPRYIYIIRLVPNHIRALMREVCDELTYSPPIRLLPLGGIQYQQGKNSFESNIIYG